MQTTNTQTPVDPALVADLRQRMAAAGLQIQPTDAFGTIDVQNDFCPGGSLGVPNGDKVIPVTNAFDKIFQEAMRGFHQKFQTNIWNGRFFTRCWHRADLNQPHFKKHRPHCVANTPGAMFHPDLVVRERAMIFSKGRGDADDYDGFDGKLDRPGFAMNGFDLGKWLSICRIQRLFLGGLATEFCDIATVLSGLKKGYKVVVLTDGIMALDPAKGEKAVATMKEAGAIFL